MRRQQRAAILAGVAVSIAALLWRVTLGAGDPPTRHVVLVAIDGLLPADVGGAAEHPSLRALERLAATGVTAAGLQGAFPALTFPAHATLVTGVGPARHQILDDWIFDASRLQAPALWQRASDAGLTTAAVSWPGTVGAPIDALIPDLPQFPVGGTWLEAARAASTPGLVDAVASGMGGFGARDNERPDQRDRFTASAAAHILRTRQPNLLLVRFVEVGLARYVAGRRGAEVSAALARADARVAEVVSAVAEAGLAGRTTFVVTGDHGVLNAHTALQPNVALRRAGLLETAADGQIVSWRAVAHRGAVKLSDPADAATAERVRDLLQKLAAAEPGTFRLLERQELAALGADPQTRFFLDAAPGYAVNDRFDGDTFLAPAPVRGHHAFRPDLPDMHAALIVSGPAVLAGEALGVVRHVDVAPTVAHALGFDMPGVEGRALVAARAED